MIGQAACGLHLVSPVKIKAAHNVQIFRHARPLYKPAEGPFRKLVSAFPLALLLSFADRPHCRLGSVKRQDISTVMIIWHHVEIDTPVIICILVIHPIPIMYSHRSLTHQVRRMISKKLEEPCQLLNHSRICDVALRASGYTRR